MRPSRAALTRLALQHARAKGLVVSEGKSVPVSDSAAPGKRAAQAVIDLCLDRDWPVPVPEHYFAKPRLWRFDLAWPDLKLAIEFQGGAYTRGRHNRPTGFIQDCEKFSTAATMGWRLLPVAYPFIRNGKLKKWLSTLFDTTKPAPTSTACTATGSRGSGSHRNSASSM